MYLAILHLHRTTAEVPREVFQDTNTSPLFHQSSGGSVILPLRSNSELSSGVMCCHRYQSREGILIVIVIFFLGKSKTEFTEKV